MSLRKALRNLLAIAVNMGMAVLAGIAIYGTTGSTFTALVVAILGGGLSVVAWIFLMRLMEFGKNFGFFRELNRQLQPPELCPALVEDARKGIRDVLAGVREGSQRRLRAGSDFVSWGRYGELLTSCLNLNENAFIATCLLTPTEFMDALFSPYRIAQEKDLNSRFWMWPGRRFRVMGVDKSTVLAECSDSLKREAMAEFFAWHRKTHIPVFFVTQNRFRQVHRDRFGTLELNDFVYFSCEARAWVMGVLTDYESVPDIRSSLPKARVIDWDNGDPHIYMDFALVLKREAGYPTRTVPDLMNWCASST